MSMQENFTDRARQMMFCADQEARRFNHAIVEPEHMLLGFTKQANGVGASVLGNLNIDLRKIRLAVEDGLVAGEETVALKKLPLSSRSEKIIKYAIEECAALGHHNVGTEHLLLGLLREGKGIAALVLASFDLTLEKVREELAEFLEPSEEVAAAARHLLEQRDANLNPESLSLMETLIQSCSEILPETQGTQANESRQAITIQFAAPRMPLDQDETQEGALIRIFREKLKGLDINTLSVTVTGIKKPQVS